MKGIIAQVMSRMGYEIVRRSQMTVDNEAQLRAEAELQANELPPDFNEFEKEVIQIVKPYTMTSPERIVSLIRAVGYVMDNEIEGDIVECGVWRGGSIIATGLTLLENKSFDKQLYLFDTFEGMSPASAADVSISGDRADELLKTTAKSEEDYLWAYSPLEKVKEAVYSIGYPKENFIFVKGKVEETIPQNAPATISILRLDTDWYESTRHELIHLFPRLTVGGVLIIDDYGHWQGARKAVDEYIRDNKIKILLNRVDYTGRIAVKQCN